MEVARPLVEAERLQAVVVRGQAGVATLPACTSMRQRGTGS